MWDHLKAAGFDIEIGDVRLWYLQISEDKKRLLEEKCKQIGRGQNNDQDEQAEESKDESENIGEVEINSGIDFPG